MSFHEIWEWYKTIVGVVSLIVIIGVILRMIYVALCNHYSGVKCPKCGHRKYHFVVGAPGRCRKCGHQYPKEIF